MIWALIILIMIDNNYDHMIRAWSGSRAVASSQGGEKGSLSSPRFCQHLRHLCHLCHFRHLCHSHHCSLPLVTDLMTDPMTDHMNSPMTNHFCLQLHVFAIFAVIAIIITITIYSNSYWIAGWGSTRYHPAHKLSTLSPMSSYCPSQFVRISIQKDCIRLLSITICTYLHSKGLYPLSQEVLKQLLRVRNPSLHPQPGLGLRGDSSPSSFTFIREILWISIHVLEFNVLANESLIPQHWNDNTPLRMMTVAKPDEICFF